MFDRLRLYADEAIYEDIINPVDGVTYPAICKTIPEEVVVELRRQLKVPALNVVFMRLSLANTPAPHQAHTDTTMGKNSFMLYLTRDEFCQGGTALVEHKSLRFASDPQMERELVAWQRDTNNPDAWRVYQLARMKANRAFIFPSNLMHRAEPVGGFGSSPYDGRLVLTAFY